MFEFIHRTVERPSQIIVGQAGKNTMFTVKLFGGPVLLSLWIGLEKNWHNWSCILTQAVGLWHMSYLHLWEAMLFFFPNGISTIWGFFRERDRLLCFFDIFRKSKHVFWQFGTFLCIGFLSDIPKWDENKTSTGTSCIFESKPWFSRWFSGVSRPPRDDGDHDFLDCRKCSPLKWFVASWKKIP